jgi:inner membrane protein
MDNITHTLTGLMLARTGLGHTTERGGSLMLMLAANTPDIDAISGLFGSLSYLQYHRGYLHSVAMAPVMAVLPLLLARRIRGASVNWRSYFACLLGVLSHLALDLSNSYGIRLYLPFSTRWLELDLTEFIDPWILLIFLSAIALPALSRIPRRVLAGAALAAFLGYEGFRFAARQRAIARIRTSVHADRVAALPDGMNPLRWRGIVETGDSVQTVPILLTQDFDPGRGRIDYSTPRSPALDAASATKEFREFLRFNQLPFWNVTPVGDATRVDLIDLRFGPPHRPGLASASAIVAADGSVRAVQFKMALFGSLSTP